MLDDLTLLRSRSLDLVPKGSIRTRDCFHADLEDNLEAYWPSLSRRGSTPLMSLVRAKAVYSEASQWILRALTPFSIIPASMSSGLCNFFGSRGNTLSRETNICLSISVRPTSKRSFDQGLDLGCDFIIVPLGCERVAILRECHPRADDLCQVARAFPTVPRDNGQMGSILHMRDAYKKLEAAQDKETPTHA